MLNRRFTFQPGFTIVELLIVIVVISILAAITIIAFNGIQQRAQKAAVSSTVKQAAQKITLYAAENGAAPSSLSDVGLATSSGDVALTYSVGSTPTEWCISGKQSAASYYQASTTGAPVEGSCDTIGLVASLTTTGIMNGVKTVIFVGEQPTDTNWHYALDLRPAGTGYLLQQSGIQSSGVTTRVESGRRVVYATNTPSMVYVGQRYSATETWGKPFRSEGYSINLTNEQIEQVIARLQASF